MEVVDFSTCLHLWNGRRKARVCARAFILLGILPLFFEVNFQETLEKHEVNLS